MLSQLARLECKGENHMPIHKKPLNRRLGGRYQRGQGMTEYIIITALIALAAISVVGAFGGVIQQQFYSMAQAMAGETPDEVQLSDVQTQEKTNLKDWRNGAGGG